MNKWFDQYGRVSLATLTQDTLVEKTNSCLQFYSELIENMLKVEKRTWENTFHVLEVATSGINNFNLGIDLAESVGLLSSTSIEYKESKNLIKLYLEGMYSNRKISLALHQLKRTSRLSKKKQYVLDCVTMSYAESFYSEDKKLASQLLDRQIEDYGKAFSKNLQNSRKALEIHFHHDEDIQNLSPVMKNFGQKCAEKLGMPGYVFNSEETNYRELMRNCTSRAKRKEMYLNYVSLASNKKFDNEKVMKDWITVRTQKAKSVKHKNYTDYATAYCGLSDHKSILFFLNNVKKHLEKDLFPYKKMMNQYAKKQYNIDKIEPWDKEFILYRIKDDLKKNYDLENIYIDLQQTLHQAFRLAKELFSLHIELDNNYLSWHPDNLCYRVINEKEDIIGHIVFDIFQREEKPDGLIYNFLLNPQLKVGEQFIPSQQAIVMHLKKDNKQTKLSFLDAENLMHEFGHALHFIVTHKEHHMYHPHTIQDDAIEFPSQWFERFIHQPEIFQQIAYQNNQVISNEKAQLFIQVEQTNKHFQWLRQTMDSTIDIILNSRFKPHGKKDFHELIAPIFEQYGEKLYRYNHYQNQFEHFFMGSLYYGYIWADHMVLLWMKKHQNKTLKEQGKMLIKLLNKSTEKDFVNEFEKLVTDPYHEEILFPKPHDLLNDLLH